MVPVGGHGNPCLGSLIASSKTLESFALPSHPPLDKCELHVHVTHTQHISAYKALAVPMCLSRI